MTAVADPWAQPLPAGAYDELLRRALPITRAQRRWEPADGRMPALFVSHGAPPTLDDPQWLDDLFRWAQTMPKPRAIVIVSAHWEDAPVAVSSAAAGTPLVYDFGGFHPRYHELQYATPDATDLAARVVGVLGGGRPGAVHRTGRGLDHGAYIPLMAMYPDADVPVLQVSMPSQDPAALLALGERLRELRDEGVLVIGSGFMTHSFAAMRDHACSATWTRSTRGPPRWPTPATSTPSWATWTRRRARGSPTRRRTTMCRCCSPWVPRTTRPPRAPCSTASCSPTTSAASRSTEPHHPAPPARSG